MEGFCPLCGDETEGVGPRGLCRECFGKEETLLEVPDSIETELCTGCGSVKLGAEWVEVEGGRDLVYRVLDRNIEDEGIKEVRFSEGDDEYDIDIVVEKDVDGELIGGSYSTVIILERGQCEDCARLHGGYYTYVVQVRGEVEEETMEALMERSSEINERNRSDFVSRVEERDGGTDIYVSSRKMAEALLRVLKEQYSVEEKRSREIVGRRDSEEIYRTVISARVT